MSDAGEGRGETGGEPTRTERVRIRRAPRLGVFVVLGVIVGVIVAVVLTSLFPVDRRIGFAAIAGYVALYGIVIGGLLGAVVGLVTEAVLARRAREVVVERATVGDPDGTRDDNEPSTASADREDDHP